MKDFLKITKSFFSGRSQKGAGRFLAENYFLNKFNGVCIECGALDGINLSVCKDFEEKLSWQCFNIEASKENFDLLTINRPNSLNFYYALSNENDKEIYITKHKRKKVRQVSEEKRNCSIVKSITYKKFIEINNINHVDLLVLDIEGHEPFALEGMIGCSILPDVIFIEFNVRENFPIMLDLIDKVGNYKLTRNIGYNKVFVKDALLSENQNVQ